LWPRLARSKKILFQLAECVEVAGMPNQICSVVLSANALWQPDTHTRIPLPEVEGACACDSIRRTLISQVLGRMHCPAVSRQILSSYDESIFPTCIEPPTSLSCGCAHPAHEPGHILVALVVRQMFSPPPNLRRHPRPPPIHLRRGATHRSWAQTIGSL